MDFTQQITVSHPRETVWTYLRDLPLVADCMPGAELTSADGERFEGRINVRLGPVAAAFRGEGKAAWDDTAHSGTIEGRGRDSKTSSQVRATMKFGLSDGDQPGTTRIAIDVDYALSGSLAQFGRGSIVNDLANRITGEFARNLEARIAAESGDGRREGRPERRASANEIRAGGLIWSVTWQRIKALFASVFGRG